MDTGWIKLPYYEVTEDNHHACQVCGKRTAMFERTTNKLTGDSLTIYICSPCLKEMQHNVQELGPFAYFFRKEIKGDQLSELRSTD